MMTGPEKGEGGLVTRTPPPLPCGSHPRVHLNWLCLTFLHAPSTPPPRPTPKHRSPPYCTNDLLFVSNRRTCSSPPPPPPSLQPPHLHRHAVRVHQEHMSELGEQQRIDLASEATYLQ